MKPSPSIVAWLFPLGMLTAVTLGAVIVRGQPVAALGVILGVMVLVPVAWVAISALWPATADRRCPDCEAETLVRADPESTVGLECSSCGWRDEAASAWLLAEEEGPLEEVVLRERELKKAARRKREPSVVDTPAPSD